MIERENTRLPKNTTIYRSFSIILYIYEEKERQWRGKEQTSAWLVYLWTNLKEGGLKALTNVKICTIVDRFDSNFSVIYFRSMLLV